MFCYYIQFSIEFCWSLTLSVIFYTRSLVGLVQCRNTLQSSISTKKAVCRSYCTPNCHRRDFDRVNRRFSTSDSYFASRKIKMKSIESSRSFFYRDPDEGMIIPLAWRENKKPHVQNFFKLCQKLRLIMLIKC